MSKTVKAAKKAAITRKLNRAIKGLDSVEDSRSIAAYKANATRAKNAL